MLNSFRPRRFKLHFNRINMQRGLPGVWTIHRSDRCIPARKVAVHVEMETIFKPNGTQPRAYFVGSGIVIDCLNGDFAIVSPSDAHALARDGQVKFA